MSGRFIALLTVAGFALSSSSAAVGAEGLTINGGAAATNNANVTLRVEPPPGAVSVQVALDEQFATAATTPVAAQIGAVIPSSAPEERVVRFWVRYLDGASQVIPASTVSEQIIFDTLPPRVTAISVRQRQPVFVCRADGPTVGGTSRVAVEYSIRVALIEAGAGGPTFELVGAGPVGPRDPSRAANVVADPGSAVTLRSRDGAGNVSGEVPVALPAVVTTLLQAHRLPFAFATDCPQVTPQVWTATIRDVWRRSGRGARDRQIVRISPSNLVWTNYRAQGPGLNWVHAATELKTRLKRRQPGRYRAGVAEAIALSATGTSPTGGTYRLNENWFTTPDDLHPPPWRDAMGTAVLLASLAPALAGDAPRHERDVALRIATEYLESFSVDARDGGLRWRDRGPGEWFLEYTYRTDSRVLNGFMQAVVSLDRFSRQADRLGRSDARWRPLAKRARVRVFLAARALNYWLPAYDLGGGQTRYSLVSGAATRSYRLYHQTLLGSLSQIDYVPRQWRRNFMGYRIRWGGTRLRVP